MVRTSWCEIWRDCSKYGEGRQYTANPFAEGFAMLHDNDKLPVLVNV
jgi:hypothetical protein